MAAGIRGINVPIGPAIVEFGEGSELVTFDITKGGIVFKAETSIQDTTVDQYGDTPVKSTMKGRNAEVTVPFALHDLERLAARMPNSRLVKDSTDPTKMKLEVSGQAGFDMLAAAKSSSLNRQHQVRHPTTTSRSHLRALCQTRNTRTTQTMSVSLI